MYPLVALKMYIIAYICVRVCVCPRSISVWHELETVHLIEVFQLFEVITVLRVQQVTPYTMQSCHPC